MINLLVTGGCGFIGSNFINYIHEKKIYNIINLDCMYYCASEYNVNEEIRKSEDYKFIKGNLCNQDLIKEVIYNNKITHVIHFAAQSHVQNSFEDSLQFTHDNILGTHTLLEVCRKYGKIELFIHVSTDEVYGESMLNETEQHKTEHSVLCPSNPYAATKAGAELIAQSYYHSYKMPIIISRGNNVYGPNQYPEKLVPKFIKLLENNKKVTIQGDGSCVRAFLHAYDTAKAFECILEKGKIGEVYNIGCDEGMEYSVLDIAKILIKMIKNTENYDDWIEYIEDRPFNDKRYYISNDKLKNLDWKISINFIDGLKSLLKNKYMYTLDDISIYILNWKKVSNNSLEIYENIKKIMNNVTIINCDESLILEESVKHIQLDDSHYFGSQYEHAIRDVNENSIFCIVVGDNIPNNDFEKIFNNAIDTFNTLNVGVFAPNDTRSPHKIIFENVKDNLYSVENTDCGFWLINPVIVSKLKNINYGSLSKYGWGIDRITIEEAKKNNLLVLRDYSIETDQLDHSTNYDGSLAFAGLFELLKEYEKINQS
jgi:dTDP-glucose 4,6-dehydratase